MKKSELKQRTDKLINETRIALHTLYDNLNDGQQHKLLKSAAVKALLDRYGVTY